MPYIQGPRKGKPKLAELPENVTLQWLGEHLTAFRDETRAELRALRGDLDYLTVIVRRLNEETIVTGGALIRIERRLDRLESERQRP